jgi:hypothetical protein
MKSPYTQRPDDQARIATEEFIAQHAKTRAAAEKAREAADQAADTQPAASAGTGEASAAVTD